MTIQKTTNVEVKSNSANNANDAVATRSTTNSSEITELELSLVKLLLTHEGLGYPKANAKSRIALKNICDAPKKYTKDQLLQARQDFLNDTDIEMPVNGKRYTIKFYGIGQDVFLLDYFGGKVSTRKTTQGQLPDESACFTAHVLKNGRVAFETVDKKWLSYPTKTPGPSWLKDYAPNGVTDKLDEAANGLELQKAGKGEHVDLGNPLNLFGKFFIKSKRGTDANSYAEVQGYWLLNTKNNTFDGAGDPYYSEELSSVMLIEPVTKTTDIRQSERTLKRTSENKIYTLSGQRVFVEKLSDLPRGIYIVNGKKLLVQ
ncbi:hypothetical protein CJ232_06465 [Hoylesella timonensis]|uniref:Uncharacterized protein n=2 Tax=Hoylesella timonensis TaxID=386414 RepID=A0A2N6Q5T8_9BACT|nr:hypothetical protein CJ232_06465 [Hoylesella timonensis]